MLITDEQITAEYSGELDVWSVGITLPDGTYVGFGCASEAEVPRAKAQVRARCVALIGDPDKKPLPTILREVLLLLNGGRESVVIERGHNAPVDGCDWSYRIRLRRDVAHAVHPIVGLSAYRCETSGWLGEEWSSWHDRRGWLGGAAFDIEDVLATDWRIVS